MSAEQHGRAVDPLAGPVVVGLAEDGRSDGALRRALALARRSGSSLEVVHAVSGVLPGRELTELAGLDRVSLDEGARLARAHLDRVLGEPDDVAVGLRVLGGEPGPLLHARGEALGAGCLVLGGHRRRGRMEWGHGLRDVLARASRPVWCEPHGDGAIARVLVPADLTDDSAAAWRFARRLADARGVPAVLVHAHVVAQLVYPPLAAQSVSPQTRADDARRERLRLEAFLARADVPAPDEVVSEDARPHELLARMTGPGDLVVMGTHGRGALGAALLGHVTLQVLDAVDVPVLALRRPGRMGW